MNFQVSTILIFHNRFDKKDLKVNLHCLVRFLIKVSKVFIFSFMVLNNSVAQRVSSDFKLDYIKESIIKNEAIGKIALVERVLNGNKNLLDLLYDPGYWKSIYLDFPGFGYGNEVKCEIISIEKYHYPDKSYRLYEFNMLQLPENALKASWDEGFRRLYLTQKKLIAINDELDLKFIAGTLLRHGIAKDFKLKKKKPDSFVPFLKLKFYNLQIDSIKFSYKENDDIFFIGTRKSDNERFEIFVNCKNPDLVKIKSLSKGQVAHDKSPFVLNLPFKDYDDKKKYIFNALTKNYFLYKIRHTPDLYDKMAIDTTTMLFKKDAVSLDSFLPNYNEYLSEMEIATVMRRFARGHCGKAWAPFQSLIFDETDNYILGNRIHPDIEFYRIYKDTIDQLFERLPDGKSDSPRFFDYYNPDLKREHESYYKRIGHPYPPLEPLFKLYSVGGGWNPCIPYAPPFPEDWQTHLDYYLVALDTKTREVYFISGRNIYLSKAMHLYSPTSKEPPADIRNWELPYKLAYLRDRLYRYQVAYLGPENITLSDNKKMVLTAVGEERGKAISLKVTFFFNRPELLDIEVADR